MLISRCLLLAHGHVSSLKRCISCHCVAKILTTVEPELPYKPPPPLLLLLLMRSVTGLWRVAAAKRPRKRCDVMFNDVWAAWAPVCKVPGCAARNDHPCVPTSTRLGCELQALDASLYELKW